MKKIKLKDIWNWSEDVKSIKIVYNGDGSIYNIFIYTIMEWLLATIDGELLDKDTFPKCPDDKNELVIDRPDNKKKGFKNGKAT